jgi:RNA polymerase sigma factor (sigma-70 family)
MNKSMVLGIRSPRASIFSSTGQYLFPEYLSLKFLREASFNASTLLLMVLSSLSFKWKGNLQLQTKEGNEYFLPREGGYMKAVENALGFIYRNLKHHRLLTAEKERELTFAIKAGDLQARKTLIYSQLKLVVSLANKIARRIRRPDLVEDFIQTGNKVVVEKVEDFDPGKARFSTFVYEPVRKAIFKELRNLPKEESVEELPELAQDSKRLDTLLATLGKILSPEEREVLKYHVSLDMTFEAIVELKGKSVRTWKRIYASAKEKLKAYHSFLKKSQLL